MTAIVIPLTSSTCLLAPLRRTHDRHAASIVARAAAVRHAEDEIAAALDAGAHSDRITELYELLAWCQAWRPGTNVNNRSASNGY